MNSCLFYCFDNSVPEVKSDRLLIIAFEQIFLYTNIDQIGSPMIYMTKLVPSHNTTKFMPNSHYCENASIHKMHVTQVLTVTTTGVNKI